MKFFPSYKLSVETSLPAGSPGAGNVEIGLPIPCEFEIRRATLSSSQVASFRLKGLQERTRDAIQRDWFNLDDQRSIQFSASYQDQPETLIFNGLVKQAQSYRPPGATEFITEIEAFDGAFAMANSFSLQSLAPNQKASDLVKKLAVDLKGLTKSPIVGTFDAMTKRGSVYAGNTWGYIQALTNGVAFIDDNRLKALNVDDVLGGDVPIIDSSVGLLGTPRRFQGMMSVPMLFEPRFTLGQLVNLQTATLTKFNGLYKVFGIEHRGVIVSDGPDGERKTELTLYNGSGGASGWNQVMNS